MHQLSQTQDSRDSAQDYVLGRNRTACSFKQQSSRNGPGNSLCPPESNPA